MPELSSSARRQPNVKARREEVLDEASRLLNANGVSQTTLQDLANVLGVTRNALYYYFKDKESLLLEVLQRLVEALDRDLASFFGADISSPGIIQRAGQRTVTTTDPILTSSSSGSTLVSAAASTTSAMASMMTFSCCINRCATLTPTCSSRLSIGEI